MSSDRPLYTSWRTPGTVNPVKIVPSLANKLRGLKQTRAGRQRDGVNFPDILIQNKDKKISKANNLQKNRRTKMCIHGRDCRKRITCSFAHTQQELRKPFLKRKNPCLLYQRGKCSLGSACRDYHGNIDLKNNYKYKQKVCENFAAGKCEKGQVCIFLHAGSDQQAEEQNIAEQEEQVQEMQPQEPVPAESDLIESEELRITFNV